MKNLKERAVQKSAVVELVLANGDTLRAKFFLSVQGRLTDMLNDDRQFLPIETPEGEILALAKSSIVQVSMPGAERKVYRGDNPYLILGVREGATAEELKSAYHKLSMLNHPDRIKGFGLSDDYQELATLNMSRINSAYAQLVAKMQAKKNANADPKSRPRSPQYAPAGEP
jgi:hypothetical protein